MDDDNKEKTIALRMNRKTLIIVFCIVIVVIGGILFALSGGSAKNNKTANRQGIFGNWHAAYAIIQDGNGKPEILNESQLKNNKCTLLIMKSLSDKSVINAKFDMGSQSVVGTVSQMNVDLDAITLNDYVMNNLYGGQFATITEYKDYENTIMVFLIDEKTIFFFQRDNNKSEDISSIVDYYNSL